MSDVIDVAFVVYYLLETFTDADIVEGSIGDDGYETRQFGL